MLTIRRLSPDPASLEHLTDPTPLGLRWSGQLAHDPELMLAGVPPTLEQAWTLSQGVSPVTRRALKTDGTTAPGPPKRLKGPRDGRERSPYARGLGFDITVCAPLGLSMLVGVVGARQRDELLNAHRQAVDATVRFLEDQLRHCFIVLLVDHPRHEGCAFVHTHAVVFSVSRVAGAWTAFNPHELHRHIASAGGVYRTTLARLTPHG